MTALPLIGLYIMLGTILIVMSPGWPGLSSICPAEFANRKFKLEKALDIETIELDECRISRKARIILSAAELDIFSKLLEGPKSAGDYAKPMGGTLGASNSTRCARLPWIIENASNIFS